MGRERGRAWWWIAAALALVFTASAHASFFDPPALAHVYDEGYVGAFATRMVAGKFLPYVDAVSHRGPLLYWVAGAATWLTGSTDWLALRICGLACCLGGVALTHLAGVAARRHFVGAFAAVATAAVLLVEMGPDDGVALSGELLLNVFTLAALTCLTLALRPGAKRAPGLALLLLAGIAVGLGVLCKQPGAAAVLALGLWPLAVACVRPELSARTRVLVVATYAAGAALPIVATLLIYAAAGELETLHYYALSYNRDVYLGPIGASLAWQMQRAWLEQHFLLVLGAVALGLWGLMQPLGARPLRQLLHAWDEDGFAPTAAIAALALLAVANVPLRGFAHYFVQVVPWFALLVALLFERALGPSSRPRATLRRGALLFVLLAAAELGWLIALPIHRSTQRELRAWARGACAALDRHAAPHEPLFIWGFNPQLYTWCQRPPASRFVYTTFVAGVVPWFDTTAAEEDAYATPGSRELLIAELEATAPPLIVDSPDTLLKRSMHRYPILGRYLTDHYCVAEKYRTLTIYERRRGAEPCREVDRDKKR